MSMAVDAAESTDSTEWKSRFEDAIFYCWMRDFFVCSRRLLGHVAALATTCSATLILFILNALG
jgi:hypothetical protein